MNKPETPIELLPCPFCGAPAKLGGKATVLVSCTKCTAATFQLLKDSNSAIEAWNKRVPLQQEILAEDQPMGQLKAVMMDQHNEPY